MCTVTMPRDVWDDFMKQVKEIDRLRAEADQLKVKNDEMSTALGCINVILTLAPGEEMASIPRDTTCAKVLERQKQFLTLENEVGRLKMLSRDPDDILLLTQQQQRIIDLTAEVERLRKALRVVLAARPSLTEKGWQVVQDALGETGKKEPEPETCVWTELENGR